LTRIACAKRAVSIEHIQPENKTASGASRERGQSHSEDILSAFLHYRKY
jgi:hypothetical protein